MDYLHGTPYQIEQPSGMYHMNADTELLGRFINIKASDDVLDIGTNNGALLLYAAMHSPASLTGIDLFQETAAVAEKNLSVNGIEGTIIVTSLQNYNERRFDVMICNPPYFDNANDSLKSENKYLRAARHSDALSLEDLISDSKRLLKEQGRLFMIYPAVKTDQVILKAKEYQFKIARMRPVYDRENGRAVTMLFELRKGRSPQLNIEAPAYLNDRATF